ncbi:hypothetical protein ERICIV_02355 [Paenibacillus larvae subsp. larvae]|uniref:Uncharacterized protein n=1 Tax=Paenibacillus larvae subsp. larvae TaxID=147375 RepID=A0A2L1U0P3_9BACL|nr:hypothetical protein ERICIII_02335 [Paenibacillus larvae subsp. larvae]AVF31271.1 hypothetical protein ERICIV_02355 [Paenibacillus larvae subsp. larvae]
MSANEIVDRFLNYLEVSRRDIDISLLNDLIRNHQLKVRWENVTKILDYERGYLTNEFLPPLRNTLIES